MTYSHGVTVIHVVRDNRWYDWPGSRSPGTDRNREGGWSSVCCGAQYASCTLMMFPIGTSKVESEDWSGSLFKYNVAVPVITPVVVCISNHHASTIVVFPAKTARSLLSPPLLLVRGKERQPRPALGLWIEQDSFKNWTEFIKQKQKRLWKDNTWPQQSMHRDLHAFKSTQKSTDQHLNRNMMRFKSFTKWGNKDMPYVSDFNVTSTVRDKKMKQNCWWTFGFFLARQRGNRFLS